MSRLTLSQLKGNRLLAVLLLAVLGAGAFCSPGVRHSHEGGEAAHSHAGSHHHHGNDHHSHDHAPPPQNGGSVVARLSQSFAHLHVVVFGIELTFAADPDAPANTVGANGHASEPGGDRWDGRSSGWPPELVRFLLTFRCLPTSNAEQADESAIHPLTFAIEDRAGIRRLRPPTPPPRHC